MTKDVNANPVGRDNSSGDWIRPATLAVWLLQPLGHLSVHCEKSFNLGLPGSFWNPRNAPLARVPATWPSPCTIRILARLWKVYVIPSGDSSVAELIFIDRRTFSVYYDMHPPRERSPFQNGKKTKKRREKMLSTEQKTRLLAAIVRPLEDVLSQGNVAHVRLACSKELGTGS